MFTRNNSRNSTNSLALAAFAASLAITGSAGAGQYIWTGGGGSLNTGWNAPSNWQSGSVPADSSDSVVYFQNNAPGNFQNVANPLSLNQIEFGPGVSTAIGGSAFDFQASSYLYPTIRTNSALSNSISNNIDVGTTLVVLGPGTGTITLSGAISGGYGLYAEQPGVLQLGGNNTYSGPTVVTAGTLALAAANALPLNANVTVGSGATLNLGTFGNGTISAPIKAIGSLTLNGGTLRVPGGNGDFWLNKITATGGNIDTSGSSAFWLHFTGNQPIFSTKASNQMVTVGGGTGTQLRSDNGGSVIFEVDKGTTPSGIDMEIAANLTTGAAPGGYFLLAGPGTIRVNGTASTARWSLEGATVRFDDPAALTSGTIDLAGGILQYGGTGSISTTRKPTVWGGWIDVPNAQATANFANGLGGGGTLHKIGAGTLALPNIRLAMLRNDVGTVRITPDGTNAGVSNLFSLAMAPTTRLDLTNNSLIVDTTGFSHLDDLTAMIKSAYANGSWTGPGITSSTAAASPGHALGIAKATDLFASPTTWLGQTINADSGLIRYTYTGDANLDGTVDTLDFNALAGHFGANSERWVHGDFNYDGVIDTLDFNSLAANFGHTLPTEAGGPTGTLVPEPGVAAVGLVLGSLSMLPRRRQRRLASCI